jgi:hypothetical protein
LNIFNPTGLSTAQATVSANTSYPGFSTAKVDDGTANGFVFGDYLRPGQTDTTNDQLMSITGFSDPSGISSLRFFDIDNYESGRVADQVTIYYSTSALTGNSLSTSAYTELGNYSLPISSTTSNNAYTSGTTSDGDAYDTLSGLLIPAGTTSILFDFGAERNHNGGPSTDGTDPNNYNVGVGFEEIQAFAPIPEPSTNAMMLGALAILGFCFRRKLA